MEIVLFDTNILIDNLEGHAAAVVELTSYDDAIISSITWMEVACKMDSIGRERFKVFLAGAAIRVVHLNDDIMERAATLRGHSITHPPKYSLPDCIVRATAEVEGRLIITRNPADFGGEGARVRVPYDIVAGVAVNIKAPPA